MARNMYPEMRYSSGDSIEAWQKNAREKLYSLLGLPFKKCVDLL